MLSSLRKSCSSLIQESRQKRDSTIVDEIDISFWEEQSIFCDYQKILAMDETPVAVIEKGRQIGFSWTMSFRAVFKAVQDKKDTLVSSYNKEAVKQFLKDSASWAKILGKVFEMITYDQIIDNQNINVYEIKFNNGRTITGLPGNPVSFRSYSGRDIIIDEAAYREASLEDYLGSALATLIHGGSVRIGSTHAGIDGDFNKLVERVKTGELPYKHIKVTFKDAVRQGLFKRICAKKKEEWSQSKENEWVADIYKMYGLRASEELDAEPSDYSQSGKIFNNFQFIDCPDWQPWEIIKFRYHDLAASEDKEDLNESACYSASVQITYVIATGVMIITDWTAEKVSPLDGDAMIERLAIDDGGKSVQIIEQEPGSTGLKYVAIMQERLIKNGIFQVFGYKPTLTKVKRAIPAANSIQSGEMLISQNLKDRDQFCNYLKRFSNQSQPLITDLGDCVSGCFLFIREEYNFMFI